MYIFYLFICIVPEDTEDDEFLNDSPLNDHSEICSTPQTQSEFIQTRLNSMQRESVANLQKKGLVTSFRDRFQKNDDSQFASPKSNAPPMKHQQSYSGSLKKTYKYKTKQKKKNPNAKKVQSVEYDDHKQVKRQNTATSVHVISPRPSRHKLQTSQHKLRTSQGNVYQFPPKLNRVTSRKDAIIGNKSKTKSKKPGLSTISDKPPDDRNKDKSRKKGKDNKHNSGQSNTSKPKTNNNSKSKTIPNMKGQRQKSMFTLPKPKKKSRKSNFL